jgi:hypothetical protein
VVAYVALFIALGGTAGAQRLITGEDVQDESLTGTDIQDESLTGADIRNNSLTGADLNEATLNDDALHSGPCEGLSLQDKMVRVGSLCIDRYEASIWTKPKGGTLITRDSELPCRRDGQDCKGKIFARSVAGVTPMRGITWFQAQQALANVGKRLPTNAEWQMAAAGTPDDSTACNMEGGGGFVDTGSFPGCVSSWGTNDMVGNLWEWVADWDEEPRVNFGELCAHWDPQPWDPGDISCVGRGEGDSLPTHFPGALVRGGDSALGGVAGPFAVIALRPDTDGFANVSAGFRGAR